MAFVVMRTAPGSVSTSWKTFTLRHSLKSRKGVGLRVCKIMPPLDHLLVDNEANPFR
ncbi:hypothetical protein D3C79_129090 [compost metagenome]